MFPGPTSQVTRSAHCTPLIQGAELRPKQLPDDVVALYLPCGQESRDQHASALQDQQSGCAGSAAQLRPILPPPSLLLWLPAETKSHDAQSGYSLLLTAVPHSCYLQADIMLMKHLARSHAAIFSPASLWHYPCGRICWQATMMATDCGMHAGIAAYFMIGITTWGPIAKHSECACYA